MHECFVVKLALYIGMRLWYICCVYSSNVIDSIGSYTYRFFVGLPWSKYYAEIGVYLLVGIGGGVNVDVDVDIGIVIGIISASVNVSEKIYDVFICKPDLQKIQTGSCLHAGRINKTFDTPLQMSIPYGIVLCYFICKNIKLLLLYQDCVPPLWFDSLIDDVVILIGEGIVVYH